MTKIVKIQICNIWKVFRVLFLATKEALVPLANVPIMSGRSIRSFRHLEHQNPSIISGDIGRAKSKFSIFTQGCLVQIFTTRGVVAPPANNLIMSGTLIQSFRHLGHQNLSIISGDIGRAKSNLKFSPRVV